MRGSESMCKGPGLHRSVAHLKPEESDLKKEENCLNTSGSCQGSQDLQDQCKEKGKLTQMSLTLASISTFSCSPIQEMEKRS